MHLRIGEAEGGSSLRLDLNGAIYSLEGLLGKDAIMAKFFDLEQTA
jgi:hypothetical protein